MNNVDIVVALSSSKCDYWLKNNIDVDVAFKQIIVCTSNIAVNPNLRFIGVRVGQAYFQVYNLVTHFKSNLATYCSKKYLTLVNYVF